MSSSLIFELVKISSQNLKELIFNWPKSDSALQQKKGLMLINVKNMCGNYFTSTF